MQIVKNGKVFTQNHSNIRSDTNAKRAIRFVG